VNEALARTNGQSVALIVDDVETNRILLARGLRSVGYATILAESGQRALSIIAARKIDIVLLDWMMPEMTGIETLQKIRATYPADRLPVIMCTAITDKASVILAINEGANDYVTKPISLPMLRARIAVHLGQDRPELAIGTGGRCPPVSIASRGACLG